MASQEASSIANNPVGIAVVTMHSVGLLLALIAVFLRFYSRSLLKKRPALNDWLIVVAWAFTASLSAIHYVSIIIGQLGQRSALETLGEQVLNKKLIPPAEVCWTFAIVAVKISVLLFYRTIFSPQKYRWVLYTAGALSISLGVANLIQTLAICSPFAKQWNPSLEGTCGNQFVGIILVAIVNLVTDLFIIFIPWPIIWHLQMSKKRKIALTIMFSIGFAVSFITLARIGLSVALIKQPAETDFWVGITAIFLVAEPNVGIVVACLPIMTPLLPRISKKFAKYPSGRSHGDDETPSPTHPTYGGRGMRHLAGLEDVSAVDARFAANRTLCEHGSDDDMKLKELDHDSERCSEETAVGGEGQGRDEAIHVMTTWNVITERRQDIE